MADLRQRLLVRVAPAGKDITYPFERRAIAAAIPNGSGAVGRLRVVPGVDALDDDFCTHPTSVRTRPGIVDAKGTLQHTEVFTGPKSFLAFPVSIDAIAFGSDRLFMTGQAFGDAIDLGSGPIDTKNVGGFITALRR